MKKLLILVVIGMGLLYWIYGGKKTVENFPNDNDVIVAFGDSLTAGYGASKGNSYPDVLAQKIDRPVVNLGLSGDTAANAPTRLNEVLAEEPYMVLIEFGANDHIRKLSRRAAVEAVAYIVDEVQAAGAIAVIVDTGGPGMDEYTKAYKQLAKEKGALFVPGIMKGIFYKPSLKSDQVHPNDKGYALVAEKVYRRIKDYL